MKTSVRKFANHIKVEGVGMSANYAMFIHSDGHIATYRNGKQSKLIPQIWDYLFQAFMNA